ncbi:hypothetical protein JNB71_01345 [Rhizobium herbae]|uniref:HPP family protein n=1 Tax=Rhizobium herbae TaxID=508661 RepID=A0ABS7H598_9HYPH|nr:hypothetical protein [Rhizobium herbae]MBW9061951.1 hypothetical protein [Rhizobium herbae]
MRAVVLTFVRLGPTFVYAAGMLFAASIILLAAFPGNPSSWALYLTLLPVLRRPAFVLLDLPGVEVWHVIAALASVAACGVYFAAQPKRFIRARFCHAHVALLALIFANTGAHSPQAVGLGPTLPGAYHWSLPIPATLLGTALVALVALACLSIHAEIIRRIRIRHS